MSSVLALKVRPKTAIFLFLSSPLSMERTRFANVRFRAVLTEIVCSTSRIGTPNSCAVLKSAMVSFGKQEPP